MDETLSAKMHEPPHQKPALEALVNRRKSISAKRSKPSRKSPLDGLSVEILKLVDGARYATSADIGAMIPLKPNTLRVKLKTLTAQGFLSRPVAQKYLDHEHGRPTLVYALGRNGAQVLGVPYEEPNRRFRFLEHALMASRIYLTFLAGALKDGADIELWQREPEDMPILWIPQMKANFANKPDGVLEYKTDRQNRFFIEAETGEVPVVRKNPRQSSILRKVLYYSMLQRLTQYPPFRVLFFLPTDADYFEACRNICRVTDPFKKGLNCFWFSFYENVRVSDPDTMLREPYWFTPSSPMEGRVLL